MNMMINPIQCIRYIEKYENGKLISKTEVGLNEDVE